MPKQLAQKEQPQIAYYGGLQPQGIIGEHEFAAHDGSTSWSDNGALAEQLERALADIRSRLEGYGGNQVRDAVLEYTSNCFFDVAMIDGDVCVVVDMSNDKAPLRAYVSLASLLRSAADGAVQAGDSAMVAALQKLLPAPSAPPPLSNRMASSRINPAPAISQPASIVRRRS